LKPRQRLRSPPPWADLQLPKGGAPCMAIALVGAVSAAYKMARRVTEVNSQPSNITIAAPHWQVALSLRSGRWNADRAGVGSATPPVNTKRLALLRQSKEGASLFAKLSRSGPSPLQTRQAWPFPAIPYSPAPVGLAEGSPVGTHGSEKQVFNWAAIIPSYRVSCN
jgi:hypothetical protein